MADDELSVMFSNVTLGGKGVEEDTIDYFLRYSLNPSNLERIFETLNEDDESMKVKQKALNLLANLSGFKPKQAEVLQACLAMGETFESLLHEKEEAAKTYGTSLGRLHECVLLILIRGSGYSLKTASLLQFVDDQIELGMSLALAILKVPSYEDEVRLNACNLLVGFTHPHSYFKPKEDVTPHAMEDFSDRIHQVSDFCVRTSLFSTIADILHQKIVLKGKKGMPVPHFRIVASISSFLFNLYLFGRETLMFRQHILASTRVVQNLLVPYLQLCPKYLPTTSSSNQPDPKLLTQASKSKLVNQHLLLSITQSLKALVMATFRSVSASREELIRSNFSMGFLSRDFLPFYQIHKTTFALILCYNVNIDSLTPSTDDSKKVPEDCLFSNILDAIAVICSAMEPSTVSSVKRAITDGFESLPISRDIPSYSVLLELLSTYTEDDQDDDEGDDLNLSMVPPLRLNESELDEITQHLETNDSELNTQRDELEDVREELARLKESSEVKDSPAKAQATTEPKRPEAPKKSLSSLGDLPSLNPAKRVGGGFSAADAVSKRGTGLERSSSRKKKKKKETTDHAKPKPNDNAPEEFLCAINRHVLKQPVRSKYGHVFEKATLDLWRKNQGSTCPITGQPLGPDDVQPDKALEAQIAAWHVQKTLLDTGKDDDFDIYNF